RRGARRRSAPGLRLAFRVGTGLDDRSRVSFACHAKRTGEGVEKMSPQNSSPDSNTMRQRSSDEAPPAAPHPARPWRTEGLPPGGGASKPRPGWVRWAVWIVAYLVVFGIFTLQDRLSGPEAVSYSEFKSQVAAKNVAGAFARGDSIEGQLKNAAPVPG